MVYLHGEPKYWRLTIHILDTASIVCFVAIQSAILNLYLINHYEYYGPYLLYFLGDFLTVIFFIGTLFKSYHYLMNKRATEDQLETSDVISCIPARLEQGLGLPWGSKLLGALPFSYISWLLYVTILMTKVINIFKAPGLIDNLSVENYFGPNSLKVR